MKMKVLKALLSSLTSHGLFFYCRYEPGDVAYLRPQNSQSMVDRFLSLLSLDPAQEISIETFSSGRIFLFV